MMRRYSLPMWRQMDRLQRDMNRLFQDYTPGEPVAAYPALNVWANQDGIIVTAEVPGISSEDLDISVVGDMLSLSGERKMEETSENLHYHRQERGFGKFTRSIQLPYQIDVQKVDAKFKNGVLEVTLPRAESDKPRKISITAN